MFMTASDREMSPISRISQTRVVLAVVASSSGLEGRQDFFL
jgi:hypothetical protein